VTAVFGKSAAVYDALSEHKDYIAASSEIDRLIRELKPDARRLLDLACGTGRHVEALQARYEVEGLDNSPDMLEIARARCPDVSFHLADLVDFTLPRRFDVICCLFGSIGYARTIENLGRSIACIARHLNPGGVAIVERWVTPDEFIEDRLTLDTVRQSNFAVARMYISRRAGELSVFDSEYLVGTPAGVSHFAERHELGLFTEEQYRAAFYQARLTISSETADLFGYGVIAAVRKYD
jgi:SAM-dependent methyltransferase